MPTKILLTGFEPFGKWANNPSGDVVQSFAGYQKEGIDLTTQILPVDFRLTSAWMMAHAVDFDFVLMLGLSTGRKEICLERVALNLQDAVIPDNAGYQPINQPILAEGPVAYLSELPLRQWAEEMKDAGIPCRLSNTAGTYVCNTLYYSARHVQTKALFVHLPAEETIPMEQMQQAVRMVLKKIKC